MSLFETISILIVLAAIFSYLNHRFLRLPTTTGGDPVPEREILLSITYSVVIFSIVVQGLSIGPLIRRLLRP